MVYNFLHDLYMIFYNCFDLLSIRKYSNTRKYSNILDYSKYSNAAGSRRPPLAADGRRRQPAAAGGSRKIISASHTSPPGLNIGMQGCRAVWFMDCWQLWSWSTR